MAIAPNTNNVNNNNNNANSPTPRPRSARPRSSAANSVTSGTTSLGTLGFVQSSTSGSRGQQHKLKSRFSVIKKLGKGTYGKVQLAINKETGQEVAIKTIKKSKIENAQDLERVRREIQIMSSIEHPHIVHIYEVFENKDKIVLVMQYAPGGELYEYVSQSKLLDDNEARRLFRQIATAIYYCHSNKICHRDLKLENILLDEKNNAKLADFGLSNVFDKRRQLSTFCGSPLYASPEIVQGSPYEGPEVDCWSLGVLLYTLVYGAMPFDGRNFKLLVKQISEANYFEPKQRSQASPLIRHLLCADPKRRANIMDICTDPWVNGAIPATPSPLNYESNDNNNMAQQPRHSLLLVAQDMVKLAPVRLDILMALLPPELSAAISVDQENLQAQVAPLASYVVRDLEPPKQEQPPHFGSEPLKPMSQNVEQIKPSEPQAHQEVEVEQPQMEVDAELGKSEEREPESMEVDIDAPGVASKTQSEDEMIVQQQKDPVLMSGDLESVGCERVEVAIAANESMPDELSQATINSNNDQMKVHVDATAQQQEISEANNGIVDNEQELLMSEVSQSNDNENKLSVPQADQPASSQTKSPVSVDESADTSGDKPEQQKKKKKKIIVVKKVIKKPKVAKQQGDDAKAADCEDLKAHGNSEAQAEKSKEIEEPAKAKDDTIKTARNEAEKSSSEDTEAEQQRLQKQLRRRSTLVAEMSDKLLQQLAADASTSGACSPTATQLKMEQAALFSQVNVSEKKEDFERRASLIMPAELELDHSRRPSFDRHQEQQQDDNNPEQAARSDSAETIKADQEDNNQSPTCVTCEWDEPDPIRSSLEIDLTQHAAKPATEIEGPEEICKATLGGLKLQQAAAQHQLGPVPITRSYKKVTFTKDGACITETGKVYSAKGDDGTMRRIERKSKVTHYPANQADFGGSKNKVVTHTETTSEEFFSSLNDKPASSTYWPGGFERLVMPSTSLLGRDDDNFGHEFHSFHDHDGPIAATSGVAHSASNASSNSSNSTDVFDDIFDNWTGAISMFERQRLNDRLLHNQDLESLRKFHEMPGSLLGRHFRRKMSSGSGRCESADAKQAREPASSNIHANMEQFRARPASAFGSGAASRLRHSGAFGGSRPNLFFAMHSEEPSTTVDDNFTSMDNQLERDPFEQLFEPGSETGDLMRQIGMTHSQLRKQFSGTQNSQQRQPPGFRQKFAGGSMQSLFTAEKPKISQRIINPDQCARAAPAPRPPLPQVQTSLAATKTTATHSTVTSRMSSSNLQQLRQQQRKISTSRDESESSFADFAAPLDAKPIRLRNMASVENLQVNDDEANNLESRFQQAPSLMQRSSSRGSLISDHLSRLHLSESQCSATTKMSANSIKKKQVVASFIELKRTSSSSLGPTTTTRSIIINPDGSKQVIETTRTQSQREEISAQPDPQQSNLGARSPIGQRQHQCDASATTDMRIQSWLQESSSNFSSSSGSKSSASFATIDNHLQQQGKHHHNQQQQQHQIPIRGEGSLVSLYQKQARLINTQEAPSSVSGPSQLLISGDCRVADEMADKKRVLCSSSSQKKFNESGEPNGASTTSTTTKMTTTSTTMQLRAASPQQQPIVAATTTTTTLRTSAAAAAANSFTDDIFGANDLDYQSQSTNSSRSILDQLRTRGLRSVLNQRLANSIATTTATSLNAGPVTTDSGLVMTEQAASSPISSQSSAGFHETGSSSVVSPNYTQQTTQNEDSNSVAVKPSEMLISMHNDNVVNSTNSHRDDDATVNDNDDNIRGINSNTEMNNEQKDKQENLVGNHENDNDNDEEDDECVKTARANIKAFRDRMKETDLFLKSLAVADEESQRQRQELFVFNDLMIRNKLNGLSQKLGIDFEGIAEPNGGLGSQLGYMSAPIQQYQCSWPDSKSNSLNATNFEMTMQQKQQLSSSPYRSQRRPSMGCCDIDFSQGGDSDDFYSRPRRQFLNHDNDHDAKLSFNRAGRGNFVRAQSLAPEVLETTRKPFMYRHNHPSMDSGTSHRSTFQTSAPDWKPVQLSGRQRPLSINMTTTSDPMDPGSPPSVFNGTSGQLYNQRETTTSMLPEPNYRRASSVARHVTYEAPSLQARRQASSASVHMTEYQRAYGKQEENGFFASSASNKISSSTIKLDNESKLIATPAEDEEELIEQSMSAYRPSSYVPKVVPQGMPARSQERHSRSYQRRSLTSAELMSSAISPKSKQPIELRHTSISERYARTHSPSPSPARSSNRRASYYRSEPLDPDIDSTKSTRRLSMGNNANDYACDDSKHWAATGRLSELEERMEANKRRREELLAASKREFASFAGKTVLNTAGYNKARPSDLSQSRSTHSGNMELDRSRAKSVSRELSPSLATDGNVHLPDNSETKRVTPQMRLVPRSSRLESMEARIKRRSYYVRVADPNNQDDPLSRSLMDESPADDARQESLDRWHSRRASTSAANCE